MAKKKKTAAEKIEAARRSFGREFWESHERTQRILAEQIAILERRIEAKRGASGNPAS